MNSNIMTNHRVIITMVRLHLFVSVTLLFVYCVVYFGVASQSSRLLNPKNSYIGGNWTKFLFLFWNVFKTNLLHPVALAVTIFGCLCFMQMTDKPDLVWSRGHSRTVINPDKQEGGKKPCKRYTLADGTILDERWQWHEDNLLIDMAVMDTVQRCDSPRISQDDDFQENFLPGCHFSTAAGRNTGKIL